MSFYEESGEYAVFSKSGLDSIEEFIGHGNSLEMAFDQLLRCTVRAKIEDGELVVPEIQADQAEEILSSGGFEYDSVRELSYHELMNVIEGDYNVGTD